MKEKNARQTKTRSPPLDYSKLPDKLEDAIAETQFFVMEKEATINYDGKQYLVRFPKDIAKVIGIKNGDKIKFRFIRFAPIKNQQDEIEIKYIRSENGETPNEKRILDLLHVARTALTTTQVSKKLGITWQTAKDNLLSLYKKRYVKMEKQGNRVYWWIKTQQ